MKDKCLQQTQEKHIKYKNSTNHGFTMDDGYELN